MNPAHFYYLLNMVAWPPIQRKASISCCKDKRKWLNWWRARSAHTVGTGSRSAACKGSMSAHGLHYFLWTYSTTVFDLLHSIIRISCVAVAMETPAFACFTAVPGTSWPLSRWVFDGSESLNCLVYLPPQLVSEQQESRPLLSPSIDDFLCETKCDGLSRPVTSNTAGTVQPRFPNSLTSQEHVPQGPAELRTLQIVPNPTFCRKVREQPSWFRHEWDLDHWTSTLLSQRHVCIQWPVKTKCSLQWVIYLFIYSSLQIQGGSEQQLTRTSSNSATKDNKQIGGVNLPGSGATSLSSMRFNLWCRGWWLPVYVIFPKALSWKIDYAGFGFRRHKFKPADLKTSLAIVASI